MGHTRTSNPAAHHHAGTVPLRSSAPLLIAGLLVAGCGDPAHTVAASPAGSSVTSVPGPASTAPLTPVPQPPSATGWDSGTPTSAQPSIDPRVLDSAARSSAVTLATTAMRLFARRTVTADQWWHDLSPLLTPEAQEAYQGTDPRNVPPTRITGPAHLTSGSLPQTARVSIPTDAGVYLVILTRTADHPAWAVNRITPPENVGND